MFKNIITTILLVSLASAALGQTCDPVCPYPDQCLNSIPGGPFPGGLGCCNGYCPTDSCPTNFGGGVGSFGLCITRGSGDCNKCIKCSYTNADCTMDHNSDPSKICYGIIEVVEMQDPPLDCTEGRSYYERAGLVCLSITGDRADDDKNDQVDDDGYINSFNICNLQYPNPHPTGQPTGQPTQLTTTTPTSRPSNFTTADDIPDKKKKRARRPLLRMNDKNETTLLGLPQAASISLLTLLAFIIVVSSGAAYKYGATLNRFMKISSSETESLAKDFVVTNEIVMEAPEEGNAPKKEGEKRPLVQHHSRQSSRF